MGVLTRGMMRDGATFPLQRLNTPPQPPQPPQPRDLQTDFTRGTKTGSFFFSSFSPGRIVTIKPDFGLEEAAAEIAKPRGGKSAASAGW